MSNNDGFYQANFAFDSRNLANAMAATARELETKDELFVAFTGQDGTTYANMEYKVSLIRLYDVTAFGDSLFRVRKWPPLVIPTPKQLSEQAQAAKKRSIVRANTTREKRARKRGSGEK